MWRQRYHFCFYIQVFCSIRSIKGTTNATGFNRMSEIFLIYKASSVHISAVCRWNKQTESRRVHFNGLLSLILVSVSENTTNSSTTERDRVYTTKMLFKSDLMVTKTSVRSSDGESRSFQIVWDLQPDTLVTGGKIYWQLIMGTSVFLLLLFMRTRLHLCVMDRWPACGVLSRTSGSVNLMNAGRRVYSPKENR